MYDDSVLKKINLAVNSRDLNELKELSRDPNLRVRKAVAKNRHSNTNIIGVLADDPVSNVNFHARIHRNYRGVKKPLSAFKDGKVPKCVICDDCDKYSCSSCIKPKYIDSKKIKV